MKVLKVSKELIKYTSPKADMTYFNIVAANKDELLHIRCYQTPKFTMIRPGCTFRFVDIIKNGEACWIVSTSKVAFASSVETGHFHHVVLPEEEPPAGSKRKICDALSSPEKSSVAGKIIQVSPISFRMEGTLAVRCLALKDDTGVAKVALFDKLATSTYAEGSSIEVTAVYHKTFNQRPQLTTTRESSCRFITSKELCDLEVTGEDQDKLKDDPDFNVLALEGEELDLEIDAIYEAYTYMCCPQITCRQKKLMDGKCPTCRGSSCRWTYRASVNIVKPDGEHQTLTLFSKDLNCLFGIIENFSDDDVIEHLVRQLPKRFKAWLAKKCLFNISV